MLRLIVDFALSLIVSIILCYFLFGIFGVSTATIIISLIIFLVLSFVIDFFLQS